jgi:hypothetical protein
MEQIKNTSRDSERAMRMSVLRKIELYLKETAMPPTRFGRLAVNDPRLVGDLRNGREPGVRLIARIEAFLAHGPEAREQVR